MLLLIASCSASAHRREVFGCGGHDHQHYDQWSGPLSPTSRLGREKGQRGGVWGEGEKGEGRGVGRGQVEGR